MPSSAFLLLRDDDFARMITFLRSIPGRRAGTNVSVGPLGRLGLLTGQFKVGATLVGEAERAGRS